MAVLVASLSPSAGEQADDLQPPAVLGQWVTLLCGRAGSGAFVAYLDPRASRCAERGDLEGAAGSGLGVLQRVRAQLGGQ